MSPRCVWCAPLGACSKPLAAPSTDEFDDDEHTAKGMARLFAEVGEAYVHLIATAVQEVRGTRGAVQRFVTWCPAEAVLPCERRLLRNGGCASSSSAPPLGALPKRSTSLPARWRCLTGNR